MEQFSTQQYAPHSRLQTWNDWMSQRLTSVDVDGSRDFIGSLWTCEAGEASLMSIHGDAATIQSSADGHRRSRSAARCGIAFQEAKSSIYRVAGREALVREGEFIFLDLQSRFWSSTSEDDKRLSIIHLPTSSLLSRVPDALGRNGITGSAKTGSGAILHQFVRSCLDHHQKSAAQSEQLICNAMVDLVALVVSGIGADTDVGYREQLRLEGIRFIERNLCDPDLNTLALAERLGVTPRYVQMLFADVGMTPSAFIRQRRLDRIRDAILRSSGKRISEIAYEYGFGDLSQFNRAFKDRFGHTPSRMRRFNA